MRVPPPTGDADEREPSDPSDPSDPDAHDVVFASLPLAVIAYCATLGVDHAELVGISGIPPEKLRDPDALVDYESLIRLWNMMLERFGDRPLGLQYASFLSPTALGVVGYACNHCRDLGEALELYARYVRLADPKVTVTLERQEGLARVSLTHESRVEAMREPMEMMTAATMLISRRMNPAVPPPLEVCFRHPRRHDLHHYAQVFDCPVRFDAEWTGASFAESTLALPIMGADPRVGRYLQQQVEAMHKAREPAAPGLGLSPSPDPSAPRPLDVRVRETIEHTLVSGSLTPAGVARTLGMSARSLQRGLQALETSFSEQLDAVRRTRALILLRDRKQPVREVAFMLGYADPRAFYRSFRRWTGRTPTEYRENERV